MQLQTPKSTSIEQTTINDEEQSIASCKLSRSNSSKSISSKISLSKSTISKCSSFKTSSSSISPFKLQFGLFGNKAENEKRTSFSSMDGSTKGILKGVQNKLTTNLSNKVAQVSSEIFKFEINLILKILKFFFKFI